MQILLDIYSQAVKHWNIYIEQMLELLFTVRANTTPSQKIKVVGSIKELGLWNTANALELNFRNNHWQGTISINEADLKIEFKLIKIKANAEIEWQQLPNNANRKFKPKFSTQFHLEWSKPAGKINSISKFSYKLKGLPAVIIKKTKQDQPDHRKKLKEFDPYSIAHNNEDSGESDEEEFLLVKRKMSDQINISSTDLEKIYYKSSAVEILSALLQKIKVYVITKELEQTHSLHNYIEEELCKLPPHYLPRWITEACFSQQNFSGKIKKAVSIFEVGKQEMMLQSLYSRTSYFILLQIQVALSLGSELEKVACCLFLPSEKYQEAIQNLSELMFIDLICFDSIQTNQVFYQHLRSKGNSSSEEQSEPISCFKEIPSIEFIVQELQRLRQKNIVIVGSIDNVTQNECLQNLAKQNTVSIIDYSIISQHPLLAQKIFNNMGQHSMYLIISDTKMTRLALEFKQQKDVVLIYDNFQKILIQGKEYFPIRSFREIIEQIKLKSKLFKESIGGEIIQRENSLVYIVPQQRMQIALKMQLECNNFVKKFSFAKVSRKGLRVKVSWNLSKEIRMLRSICEIKLMNYGELGDFNLLATHANLKDIREDLKLLVENEPKFFNAKTDTKITYYCYNRSKQSLTLVPQNINLL